MLINVKKLLASMDGIVFRMINLNFFWRTVHNFAHSIRQICSPSSKSLSWILFFFSNVTERIII